MTAITDHERDMQMVFKHFVGLVADRLEGKPVTKEACREAIREVLADTTLDFPLP